MRPKVGKVVVAQYILRVLVDKEARVGASGKRSSSLREVGSKLASSMLLQESPGASAEVEAE